MASTNSIRIALGGMAASAAGLTLFAAPGSSVQGAESLRGSVRGAASSSPGADAIVQDAPGSSAAVAGATFVAVSAMASARSGRRSQAATSRQAFVSSNKDSKPKTSVTAPATASEDAKIDPAAELGVTAPFNFWDPLGLAADGDAVVFRRRRMAEIKNGRVAMIACMGYIAPEYFRWPGYCSPSQDLKFADIPNGVAALVKLPAEGWAQMGIFVAFLELFPLRQEPDMAPGDFPTCGKLGVPWFFVAGKGGSTSDPVANKKSLEAEINNGRLAMVAITGMISQNAFLGTTGPEMWFP